MTETRTFYEQAVSRTKLAAAIYDAALTVEHKRQHAVAANRVVLGLAAISKEGKSGSTSHLPAAEKIVTLFIQIVRDAEKDFQYKLSALIIARKLTEQKE